MTDDSSKKKKLEQETEASKKETARLETEKRDRDERLLLENIRAKKKILERPLLEEIKRKPPATTEEKDILAGADDTGPSDERAEKGVGADHPGGGVHHGTHDSHDSHGPHDAGQGLQDGGYDDGGGGVGDGGGDDASGIRRPPRQPLLIHGKSFDDVIGEAVLRSWDNYLKDKGEREGVTFSNLSQRRWAFEGIDGILNRRMFDDLRVIEERTGVRKATIRRLNTQKLKGGLTPEERQELQDAEDEEARRYWLRERFIRRSALKKQENIPWLRPLGEGADGATPYTVLTTWSLMSPAARKAARWHYDNNLLRWQNAMVSQYLPKKPKLTWFKSKAIKGIETLFEDWNEEIYSDKKWAEMVKKGQAQLDDVEEELMGYDSFTAGEEKKIQDLFKKLMDAEISKAKEEEFYS